MPVPQRNNNTGNSARNNRREQSNKTQQTRVNDRIRAPRVRVVTAEGDQLGIMPTREALARAKDMGLDLVEVAPNADPPVCRLIDYGKFKYMLAKQQKNNKTKAVRMKEVKLRIGTDVNDYNVKMARTEQFLDHGHKVRFQLRFRGRENAHQQMGLEVMAKVVEDMRTMARVDQPAKLVGNTVGMVLAPLPANQRVKKFKKYEEEGFDAEDEAFDAEDED
ncbi:MAG: translation initiation factor IF-3 [Akkermansiaceae bacterium]|nr:translation initiation factor IF-3 [Akkermansiaceae bacterium]